MSTTSEVDPVMKFLIIRISFTMLVCCMTLCVTLAAASGPSEAAEPKETAFEASMPPDYIARRITCARQDSAFAAGNTTYSFYQKYVSPVRGGRCPMHPSCSVYGMESIKKYGLIPGIAMSCERLCRCGRDLQFYRLVYNYKGIAYEDLVP